MNYQVKVTMSEGGRDGRDQHSIVMLGEPAGETNYAEAAAIAADLGGAIANVLFDVTHLLRVTFTPLDSDGKAIENGALTVPLALIGLNEYEATDGPASEHVVLRIAKAGNNGRAGSIALRHAVSADEYASYLNDGAMPARLAVAPAGATFGLGDPVGDNILLAFTGHGWAMKLKPIRIDGVLTEREVVTVAAQDFRNMKPTRKRVTPERGVINAAQREINHLIAEAWRLFHAYVLGSHPADVVSTVLAIIASVWSIYNGLPAIQRARLVVPAYPSFEA